ncbi:MAG: AraC family transcriptional regulator [Ferruginibacter sp.]
MDKERAHSNSEVIIQKYIPIYPLSIYIEHIFYMSGYMPLDFMNELPDGKINLIIEQIETTINTVHTDSSLSKTYKLKKAWVTGIQSNTILYEHKLNSSVISIHFTVGGFSALTGIPITELQHIGIDAEAILGNAFKDFYQQLINTSNILEKFLITENYFLQFYRNNNFEKSLIRYLDSNIEKPLDWLVKKSGYSQKHLIKLTKTNTGFSPKFLQRLNRFQNVLKDISVNKNEIDWASIVYKNGFYDQAHFIKDFLFFSDMTPSEYLKAELLPIEEENPTLSVILQYSL